MKLMILLLIVASVMVQKATKVHALPLDSEVVTTPPATDVLKVAKALDDVIPEVQTPEPATVPDQVVKALEDTETLAQILSGHVQEAVKDVSNDATPKDTILEPASASAPAVQTSTATETLSKIPSSLPELTPEASQAKSDVTPDSVQEPKQEPLSDDPKPVDVSKPQAPLDTSPEETKLTDSETAVKPAAKEAATTTEDLTESEESEEVILDAQPETHKDHSPFDVIFDFLDRLNSQMFRQPEPEPIVQRPNTLGSLIEQIMMGPPVHTITIQPIHGHGSVIPEETSHRFFFGFPSRARTLKSESMEDGFDLDSLFSFF